MTAIAILYNESATWGDYDGDDDLDLLDGGVTFTNQPRGGIYINEGGTYTKFLPFIGSGFGGGPVAWGDYDNDGDADIIAEGRIYRNNFGSDTFVVNTPPAAPITLVATVDSPTSAVLSWTSPTGDQTSVAGLTYNLRVGTTPGGSDVLAALALPDGTLIVPQTGNLLDTTWRIRGLTTGTTYYWSVQAVDAGMMGSAFATEGSFRPSIPPTTGNASITAIEDIDYTFQSTDFPFSDADSADTLQFVRIAMLPASGTLSVNGSSIGAGQDIAVADITSGRLTYRGPLNASGPALSTFTFQVGDGGAFSPAVATMTISVTGVADEPSVLVSPAFGNEDTAIPLAILIQLADTDVSESLSNTLTISGVSAGATLSAGTNNGGGTWTLTLAQLPGLTITPAANSDADFTLIVTATSTEVLNGSTANGSTNLNVIVVAVADTPTLDVVDASGTEGTAIPLNILAGLSDSSETLRIVVSGVPVGTTLSAGFEGPVGIWTLTPAQLSGLTIFVPDNASFDLTVSAISTESSSSSTAQLDKALRVVVSNVIPTASIAGKTTGLEGTSVSLTGSATDPSSVDTAAGFTYSWSVSKLHSGVTTPSFASGRGSDIVFTPDDGGTFIVSLTAIDKDLAVNVATTHTVTVVNVAPTLANIGNQVVSEGSALDFTASATDPAGVNDPLTYSFVGFVPANASLNLASGVFLWTPTETQDGTQSFTIRATDPQGGFDEEAFSITVIELATTPTLSDPGNKSFDELTLLSFTLTGSDPDIIAGENDVLSCSISSVNPPVGLNLDPNTGAVTWTPTEAQDGMYPTTFRVTDLAGAFAERTITITVTEVNVAPTLDLIGSQSIAEGTLLTFTVTASDPDLPANSLTFSLDGGAPAGASITSAGVFTWTPTEAQGPGSYSITVRVSDGTREDFKTISVDVTEANLAPTLATPGDQTLDEGTSLTFTLVGSDPDVGTPQSLRYTTAAGWLPGMSFDSMTGAFAWTPTETQNGTHPVIFRVTDSSMDFDEQSIAITVGEVNTAPTLDVLNNGIVRPLGNLVYTLAGRDVDFVAGVPQTVTYRIVFGAKPGMNLDPATGVFSWSPTELQDGTFAVTFRVTDAFGAYADRAITIQVPKYRPFVVSSGTSSRVSIYNADQSVRSTSEPLSGTTGGVRATMADVNGAGVLDLIAASGLGSKPEVVVVDGVTSRELARFLAFESTFTGGLYVASGDMDGDGLPEVVVTADQ